MPIVHEPGSRPINGYSMFAQLQIDLKARTVNLIGPSNSVQHYVDDGKGPPPMPQGGAMLNPGIGQPGLDGMAIPIPVDRVMRRVLERNVQIIPLPDLLPEPKR